MELKLLCATAVLCFLFDFFEATNIWLKRAFLLRSSTAKAQHHILIVTNKQIPTVSDVEDCDEQMLGHLFLVAKKIAKDLGVAESGYRLIVNCGPDGGQEVPHIHMHLLAGGKLGGLGFPDKQ